MNLFQRTICVIPFLFSVSSYAQDKTLKISDIPTHEDTSVIIKKGVASFGPDFEIVSGVDEVAGDPLAGSKESHASWKVACENWKKETRELNKTNQVLSLNCNLPMPTRIEGGLNIYHSSASYKLRVRIRNGNGAGNETETGARNGTDAGSRTGTE